MSNSEPSASSSTCSGSNKRRSRSSSVASGTFLPKTGSWPPSIRRLWTGTMKHARRLWHRCRERYREYQEEEARLKEWRRRARRRVRQEEEDRYRQEQMLFNWMKNGYPH